MRTLSASLAGFLLAAFAATASAAAPVRLQVGVNFTGSTSLESGVAPPDTDGAVGRSHIVELLNGRYAVYDQHGRRLVSISMDQFWNDAGTVPRGFLIDPRVVFDAAAQRWYASAFSSNGGNGADDLMFAVSRDADPTRGWVGDMVPFAGPTVNFVDFPTLGFDRDAAYVFTNGAVLVVPKSGLLAPNPTFEQATLLPSTSLLTPSGTKVQPVVDLDDTAMPQALLGTWDVEGNLLRRWNLSGSPTAPVLDPTEIFIQLAAYPLLGPQGALQPETAIGLNPSSPFLATSIVRRNGVLWGVQTVNNQGRAALRWFAIDAQSNTVLQEGLVADASHDLFMGSIAVNACNDVVIGFSESGTDLFASAYAVAGVTENNRTTFGDPVLLKAGVAPYDLTGGAPTARWGDYSATVVDPQHPSRFWTFQEWPSGPQTWSTQITELRLHGGGRCSDG
jgi:hypothetical protein